MTYMSLREKKKVQVYSVEKEDEEEEAGLTFPRKFSPLLQTNIRLYGSRIDFTCMDIKKNSMGKINKYIKMASKNISPVENRRPTRRDIILDSSRQNE